jgi:hypothetical protein
MKGFKAHHQLRYFLDGSVILLKDIVQILHSEYSNKIRDTKKIVDY